MIHTQFLEDDWIDFPLDKHDWISGDWNDAGWGFQYYKEMKKIKAKKLDDWWFHEMD